MQDDRTERLTLAQAAVRLGIAQDSVRRQIRRGDLRAYKDNRGRWLVELPAGPAPGLRSGPLPGHDGAELVRELRAQIERLDRELSTDRTELQGRIDDLCAERDRLLALVEQLAAECRPRRPWPGLRKWQLIEGRG